MNILPDELLLHVFGFVSPHFARHSISLVCRRWNRIVNDCQRLPQATVLYENAFDYGDLTACLATSACKTLNVYLVGENVCNLTRADDDFYAFWRTCGAKIVSLTFDNRNLTYDTFERVLRLCPRLRRLSLKCNGFVDELFENYKQLTVVGGGNGESTKLDFTAPSVTSLHFERHSSRTKIDNFMLLKILSIFPNLNELTLTLTYYHESTSNGETYFPFTALYDYVDTVAKRLDTLRLFVELDCSRPTDQGSFTEYLGKLIALKRMKVSLNACIKVSEIPRVFIPGPITDKITTLKVCLLNGSASSQNFILQLLHSCQKLLDLYLHLVSPLNVNASVIEKILASRLKTLHLDVKNNSGNGDLANIAHHFHANHQLESITIQGRGPWTTSLWTVFLPYLRNLRHMSACYANDEILQKIFEHQKRLKSLSLEYYDECTDFGFTGRSADAENCKDAYSIQELTELEYFTASDYERNQLTSKTFSHFILPALKAFRLHVRASNGNVENIRVPSILNALTQTLVNSSNLQVFEYISHGFQYIIQKRPECPTINILGTLLPMAERLKHLRYLHVNGIIKVDLFEKSAVNELFEKCPSLRSFHFDRETFASNVLTKEIKQYDEWRQRYLFKERCVFIDDPVTWSWKYYELHAAPA